MKNKILWNMKKWLILFFLTIIYIPFATMFFFLKLANGEMRRIAEIASFSLLLLAAYRYIILKSDNMFFTMLPVICSVLLYLLVKYTATISLTLKTVINAEYTCKYGTKIKWSLNRKPAFNHGSGKIKENTATINVEDIKNTASTFNSDYEKKLYEQQMYYENITKKKDEELEAIRNQNEHSDLFVGVTDIASLKKRYHDLLKVYHPDNESGNIIMTLYLKEKYEEEMKKYI